MVSVRKYLFLYARGGTSPYSPRRRRCEGGRSVLRTWVRHRGTRPTEVGVDVWGRDVPREEGGSSGTTRSLTLGTNTFSLDSTSLRSPHGLGIRPKSTSAGPRSDWGSETPLKGPSSFTGTYERKVLSYWGPGTRRGSDGGPRGRMGVSVTPLCSPLVSYRGGRVKSRENIVGPWRCDQGVGRS